MLISIESSLQILILDNFFYYFFLSMQPLIERQHGDGFTRFGFQNIRGASINNGLEIATEIDTMFMLGTDIQGLSETNKPWTPTNRWKYDFMMDAVFNQAKTIYSSTSSDPQCKIPTGRQPSFHNRQLRHLHQPQRQRQNGTICLGRNKR